MYHYADGSQQRGPVAREALRGLISSETLVWREGMAEWRPAGEVEDLREILSPTGSANSVAPSTLSYAKPQYQGSAPGLAVAAMVMGILSIVLLCVWPFALVSAILAITFGFIAQAQCQREQRTGRGMALTGIILGLVPIGIVLIFLAIIAVVAIAGASGM